MKIREIRSLYAQETGDKPEGVKYEVWLEAKLSIEIKKRRETEEELRVRKNAAAKAVMY